jgi:hypothetical protein
MDEEYVLSTLITESSSTRICDLVVLAITAEIDASYVIDVLATWLQVSLTTSTLDLGVIKCQELLNAVSGTLTAESQSEADSVMLKLAAGAPDLYVTKVLYLHGMRHVPPTADRHLLLDGESDSLPAHSRQLMGKKSSSRTSGSSDDGYTVDAIPSADVSSQNWTVADLDVPSEPISGDVLVPRTLGRRNAVLGGLVRVSLRLDNHS